VTYFTIQKFLQSHFLGKDENAEPLPPKNPSQPRKKAKKEKKERVAGEPNPRSPFCRPMKLSEALSKLTGASCLGRPQVTKRVWQYIRTHNAQNPADKREIVCDEAMRAVFKCERLNMMQVCQLDCLIFFFF
jgi:upstream activation factor subunit UAF30